MEDREGKRNRRGDMAWKMKGRERYRGGTGRGREKSEDIEGKRHKERWRDEERDRWINTKT